MIYGTSLDVPGMVPWCKIILSYYYFFFSFFLLYQYNWITPIKNHFLTLKAAQKKYNFLSLKRMAEKNTRNQLVTKLRMCLHGKKKIEKNITHNSHAEVFADPAPSAWLQDTKLLWLCGVAEGTRRKHLVEM